MSILRKNWIAASATAYFIVAAVTFGYAANNSCYLEALKRAEPACALALSTVWPIYWPFMASFEVFRR